MTNTVSVAYASQPCIIHENYSVNCVCVSLKSIKVITQGSVVTVVQDVDNIHWRKAMDTGPL